VNYTPLEQLPLQPSKKRFIMSNIKSNSEFQQTLYKILPEGFIWPSFREDSTIRTIVDSIAYNVREQELDSCEMLDSSFPDSSNYIGDWERVLDLPKSKFEELTFNVGDNNVGESLGKLIVSASLPSDINIRVSQVLSFFNSSSYNNEQTYIDMGEIFNIVVDSVITVSPFNVELTISSGDPENIEAFEGLANFFKPCFTDFVLVII
jgi:hypothetical protein